MFPFSGSKKVKKIYIPVDMVMNYSSQGMSEPEIISRLQAQGFAPEHIDKALRIALKEKVISGAPPTPMEMTEPAPEAPMPTPFGVAETPTGHMPMGEVTRRPMPIGYPPERIIQNPIEQPVPQQDFEQPQVQRPEAQPTTEITVEEIIEAIIAERWKDFEERLNNFEKKDLQLQNQIEDIRKKIGNVENLLEVKEKTMISKLEEFGGSMENIEGRIGSIERVFKDFMPELTTNIKTMSDLVERMKKEK